jgi:hypothetical protein
MYTNDISILNCECPLSKLDVHHRAYEIDITFDDVIFDSTQEVAKRYNFKEADGLSILNYLSDAIWVYIFGTSDANTCVSLFYDKLERSSELFVPVFRSLSRPMTHPWYPIELLKLQIRKARAFKYSSHTGNRELYER